MFSDGSLLSMFRRSMENSTVEAPLSPFRQDDATHLAHLGRALEAPNRGSGVGSKVKIWRCLW